MKGDASCHVTSPAFRAGYDKIDWNAPASPLPARGERGTEARANAMPVSGPATKLERFEEIVFAREFKPRPADAPPKYNGGIRCDMDRGPCACGATHGM